MAYLFFFLGFVVLLLGAKWLVDGASSIGKKLGLPQIIIGLTIVALGTSLPELVINVFASIRGSSGLAIGNVIGSNIMNTLLIIGVAALIYPISMTSKKGLIDTLITLGVTLVLLLLANTNFFTDGGPRISMFDGLILLALLFGFLTWTFVKKGALQVEAEESDIKDMSLPVSIAFILLGSLGLFFGGKWIVNGVNQISTDFGLAESVIGLTIIAAATSLPELVTSVIAAFKKNTDLAVGNAIGSNLFNILMVLGLSAVINPIDYDTSLNNQLFILIGSTILIVLFIIFGIEKFSKVTMKSSTRVISRLEGTVLICLFLVFLYISLWN